MGAHATLHQPTTANPARRRGATCDQCSRAAEFTYQITGVWVQRLAIEDVRILDPDADPTLESVNRVGGQVCLRGYTYFFIPWHRYRIDLDGIGRTALRLVELPLVERCWE
ncbi:MAG: hypothetical protein R2867_09180 [Caldilineaceae bacterium]